MRIVLIISGVMSDVVTLFRFAGGGTDKNAVSEDVVGEQGGGQAIYGTLRLMGNLSTIPATADCIKKPLML